MIEIKAMQGDEKVKKLDLCKFGLLNHLIQMKTLLVITFTGFHSFHNNRI
jgi:hypothetical protein